MLRLTVLGEVGANYGIETSTNVLNWTLWTNQTATNGTMSILDSATTNHLQKFYRAILMP
jgi:hypothetical protein